MLGLRKEVHCDPVGRGLAVADDQNLVGPEIMSIPTVANTRRLCCHNPGVPRPYDLVDADVLRAVGGAGDRARSPAW